MQHTSLVRATTVAFAIAVIAGCGGGSKTASPTVSSSSSGGGSSSTTTKSTGTPSGRFSTGKATIVTSSETITVNLDSGSFIKALGAHGSVSVNWSDADSNDVGLLGDGNGGYKLSVVGRAAPNGVTQNDCTPAVTKDEAAGVEGTYSCGGGITGTFEAH